MLLNQSLERREINSAGASKAFIGTCSTLLSLKVFGWRRLYTLQGTVVPSEIVFYLQYTCGFSIVSKWLAMNQRHFLAPSRSDSVGVPSRRRQVSEGGPCPHQAGIEDWWRDQHKSQRLSEEQRKPGGCTQLQKHYTSEFIFYIPRLFFGYRYCCRHHIIFKLQKGTKQL